MEADEEPPEAHRAKSGVTLAEVEGLRDSIR